MSDPVEASDWVKITVPPAPIPVVCWAVLDPLMKLAETLSPLVPEVPEVPEDPLVPDVPEVPVVPDVPLVPEVPEIPEVPDEPLDPEVPEDPAVPLPVPPEIVTVTKSPEAVTEETPDPVK